MLFFTLFIVVVTQAWNGSYTYEDCLARNLEPKACFQSEGMNKLGKNLCNIQSMKFDNKKCVEK